MQQQPNRSQPCETSQAEKKRKVSTNKSVQFSTNYSSTNHVVSTMLDNCCNSTLTTEEHESIPLSTCNTCTCTSIQDSMQIYLLEYDRMVRMVSNTVITRNMSLCIDKYKHYVDKMNRVLNELHNTTLQVNALKRKRQDHNEHYENTTWLTEEVDDCNGEEEEEETESNDVDEI